MIRNIIFDWSGTLVDDLPAVWQATNRLFRRAGLEEFTLERFRSEFCLPFKLFYDRFLPGVPLAQLEEWFHGHMHEVQESVVELPYAREFLEACFQRRMRLFVLSAVHRGHFARQSEATGLGRYFEKPYVEVLDKCQKIEELLEEQKLDPEETLMIGDMVHDIEAARMGGIYSCAVLTGYSLLAPLRASEPDLIVEHLGELGSLLERQSWQVRLSAASEASQPEGIPVVTVGALIFNRAGQVLMVRTGKWSNLWGIPGGKVKWGEASIEALAREIREETGLEIAETEFVLVQDCIGSKEFYREAHFVLLNYVCRAVSGEVVLNEEAQEYRWVELEEALNMPLNQPTRVLVCESVSRGYPGRFEKEP